jgi:hypothetical protein
MMNERIEAIAKEAGINLDYFGYGSCTDGGNPNVKKLAELIVKECAAICKEQRDPLNLNYKPSEKFAEAIKQHFGVK